MFLLDNYYTCFYPWANFAKGSPGARWERIRLPVQEMQVQSLGQEDPLEKEIVTHTHISCLGNAMDREAWQATVHGVAKKSDAV